LGTQWSRRPGWKGLRRTATSLPIGGYDGGALVDLVESHRGRVHIHTGRDHKVQRWVDPVLCRQGNLIKRSFDKLKHFRHIAACYDKIARNFLAAVLLAATRLWMQFESTSWLGSAFG
jgi:transposase